MNGAIPMLYLAVNIRQISEACLFLKISAVAGSTLQWNASVYWLLFTRGFVQIDGLIFVFRELPSYEVLLPKDTASMLRGTAFFCQWKHLQ
jgi:hypothetical protein